jgi:hypothetical protein
MNHRGAAKKKLNNDIRKVKRPQSVAAQRQSQSTVKINSFIRSSELNYSTAQIDNFQSVNEYGGAEDYKGNRDACDRTNNFS